MVLKVGFVTGSNGLDFLMYELNKEIRKEKEIDSYFLAFLERNLSFLESKNISKRNVFHYNDGVGGEGEPDIKFLQEKEKEYGFDVWHLWSIFQLRVNNRWKIPKKIAFYRIEHCIRKCEEFLNNIDLDYLVTFGPAGYRLILLELIAEKKGVKIIEFVNARIRRRFVLKENMSYKWQDLCKEYEKIKKSKNPDLSEAKLFIENFRLNKPKPDSNVSYDIDFKTKIRKLRYFIKLVIKYRQLPELEKLIWKIKYFWIYLRSPFHKFNNKYLSKRKYVFFPLHCQPEASTLYFGRWYVDQKNLVKILSRTMPPGYTLYVKENKTQMGSRSFHFLEEIRKIPNVKFISPKEDTFKLIENCSLLVTITGTAGFEAILFNKPVITFGDVYFNEYSHTTKIRDLDLLSKTIRDKIFNKEKSPERDIQLFVQAILNSSYEGLIRAPADCNNYSLKKDNVKLLAKGVISKLK